MGRKPFHETTWTKVSSIFSKRWIRGACLILFFLGGAIGLWIWKCAYGYLAMNTPLDDPDAVIVEGWIPYHALKKVHQEVVDTQGLKVIVAGAARGHTVVNLGGHPQSTWIAYLNALVPNSIHADTLYVTAWGNSVAEEMGQMRLLLNDEPKQTWQVTDKPYVWKIPLEKAPIDKVALRMTNTTIGSGQGIRRIFFRDIRLDTIGIPLFAPFTAYAFSAETEPEHWFETPQHKNAAIFAGKMLAKMGLDEKRLVILPTPEGRGSRTLQSAQVVGQWLADHQGPFKRINLYSQAAHTRRSYEMYQKVLPDSVELGAIALPDYQYNENWTSTPTGRKMMLEQLVKYFVSKILFI